MLHQLSCEGVPLRATKVQVDMDEHRITCQGPYPQGGPLVTCFHDALLARTARHFLAFGEGSSLCYCFEAYLERFRSFRKADGQPCYEITLALDGAIRYDDDTPLTSWWECYRNETGHGQRLRRQQTRWRIPRRRSVEE